MDKGENQMEQAGTSLQNKRLLLLGSTPNIAGMVRTAQAMGVYVLVTDNKKFEDAPAKQIADEYADISLADIDAVAQYIKEKQIDGVLTGFSDSYLTYYRAICEKTGLPCYGDAHTFDIATDKMCFKQACDGSGVGTIPGTNAYAYEEAAAFAQKNGYPLMLKPADNSGSRGVIKCECEDELKNAYEYALSFSPTKNVICERFMDCDGIGVSYQLIDGEAYLSSTCDRVNYCAAGDGSSITGDLLYPSKYTDRYIKEMDETVKAMLKKNGFRHGMVSLQSFVDDNGFYMCEMCYRPSGGHHYILIDDQNGIDSLKLLIEFAVTGKVAAYEPAKETPCFPDMCALTHIIGKPGETVASAEGFDTLTAQNGVIDVVQDIYPGTTIGKDGTTAQVVATVWFKAADLDGLKDMANAFPNVLRIQNAEGQSLIKTRYFTETRAAE